MTLSLSPAARLVDHTRHRTALRLLPFLFVLYITNYLDRTSLAYAAIGMRRDLGFSDTVIGFAIGIFFVSYVALQIPGALLVERWSARGTISIAMVVWGSMTALTALVHTPVQLYAARFLLGAAEAGFFAGVIVYLSHWFLQADRAKATSNFMSAIPLSFVLGSPLAGLILAISFRRLSSLSISGKACSSECHLLGCCPRHSAATSEGKSFKWLRKPTAFQISSSDARPSHAPIPV